MIEQSSYWKRDLIKTAGQLEKRYRQKVYSVRSLFAIEKQMFYGFYAIRKLIEAKAVEKKILGNQIALTAYPVTEAFYANLNGGSIFKEQYNYVNGERVTLSLKELCHQFVHSYNFSLFTPVDGLYGFYIASDRDKAEKIYYITLQKVVEIFLSVGSDKIIKTELIFNKKGAYCKLPLK